MKRYEVRFINPSTGREEYETFVAHGMEISHRFVYFHDARGIKKAVVSNFISIQERTS